MSETYDEALFEGAMSASRTALSRVSYRAAASRNYSYYPVLFSSEETLLACLKMLNDQNVFPRRYFYPSLDEVEALSDTVADCRLSRDVARRVLCLPLSAQMDDLVSDAVIRVLNQ